MKGFLLSTLIFFVLPFINTNPATVVSEPEIYLSIQNKFSVPKDVRLIDVSVDDVSRIRKCDTYFTISPVTPGIVKIAVKTSKGTKTLVCRKAALPGNALQSRVFTDTVYNITGPFL